MAKKPTRKQSLSISGRGLKPSNWLVAKNPVGMLYIRHRKPGTVKKINTSTKNKIDVTQTSKNGRNEKDGGRNIQEK